MATSAPAPSATVSASSSSTVRWGRSGEPGSAFSGLTRPGRGRGRGGGFRGGRGGARGNPSSKELKLEEDNRSTKPDNSQSTQPALTKPPAQSLVSASKSASEKPSMPTPSSSKSKPSSRRASRAIPPAVNTQLPVVEVASAPTSARPSNRRRRSQTGRTNAALPSKITPPAPNDNLLRPNRSRLAPVPHTAPIKDTPPHLNQRFDMRHDIDALVERVRAVAMDNRPSTPGSHIDWAGDDDDSLPDLDDWGVSPATFGASKSEVISPIIVEGLRSLPDIASNSITSSPLRQVQELAASSPDIESYSLEDDKAAVSPSPDRAPTPTPPAPIEKDHTTPSNIIPKDSTSESKDTISPPAKSFKEAAPLPGANNTVRKPLHPSLPAKPFTGPIVSHLKLRPGATPMRTAPYPRSPVSANKETFAGKGSKPINNSEQALTTDVPVVVEGSAESKGPIIVEQLPAEEEKVTEEPKGPEPLILVNSEAGHPSPVQSAKEPVVNEDFDDAVEGLAASMHAPKAIADSVSAPADLPSYSDLPSASVVREAQLTHTRAHTVGRPPSFPRPSRADHNPRFSRSGHTTPQVELQGGYHARTHSSPPAGAVLSHHRSPATRPVITGDAISRLARTIGKASSVSPPKSQTIATLAD